MKVRAGHSMRLYWLLLLAAAAIVPSCGSSHHNGSSGAGAGTSSANPSVSGDGRFVAFDSNSGNLNTSGTSSGSGSSRGTREIFLFDRSSATTKQLSQGQGSASNGDSSNPVISQDGQWVAFQSISSNLIGSTAGGTTAGTTAATTSGTTSSSTGSTTSGGASAGRSQIFVTNVSTGQTRLVSSSTGGDFGNGDSMNPSISSNGQMIAFESNASNMVSGSTSSSASGRKNVFVWNMSTNQVQLVSATADGSAANADSSNPSISADGRFVAFQSASGNFISGGTTAGTTSGVIGSAGAMRIFVRDIQGNSTMEVTPDQGGVAVNGDSSNPSISGGGSFVAFESRATNLISGGSSSSTAGRSNIFVWSRATGQSTLASVAGTSSGTSTAQADGDSHNPAISSDGHFVAFDSQASNLTGGTTSGGSAGGTSGASNVFVKDLQSGAITRVSQAQTGTTTAGTTSSSTTGSTTTSGGTTASTPSSTNALASSSSSIGSTDPSSSQDGTWVAFSSDQSGLTSDSTSGSSNVFLANRTTGEIILVSKQAAGSTAGTTTSGTTAGTTTGATTAGTTSAGTTTAGTTTAGTTAAGTTTAGSTGGGTTGATGATTGTTFGTTTGTTP